MRLILTVSALALAACTTQPREVEADPVASGPVNAPAAGPQATAERPIQGRFIVTSIDGAPPVINIAGHEPTVTIEGDRVHFQSQCIYADWTLARTGGQVSAKPYFEPVSGMCARGLAPGEKAIQSAFTGLSAIVPTAAGGLVVEGGGHRLDLRRAAAPAEVPPAPLRVATLEGEWRVAAIDGKEFNESYGLALSGSERELWWHPRCAGMARSYRIEGRTIEFGPRLGAPAPGATPAPVCAIGLPARLGEVVRALDAAKTVVRTSSNGVLIAGDGRSVLLFSQ